MLHPFFNNLFLFEELCTIRTHAHSKAHNSAQLHPFTKNKKHIASTRRRGGREPVKNGVARQIRAAFDDSLPGIIFLCLNDDA